MSSTGAPHGSSAAANGLSLVAADLSIHGSLESEGEVRVLGRIDGDVSAGRVVIGPGARVGGSVTVTGPEAECLVAGEVSGPIRADRVEIRPEGAAAGGIAAREASIAGRVAGAIAAESLVLEETASVEGRLRAGSLAIAEGARLTVEVSMGDVAADSALREQAAARAPALVAEIVEPPPATLNSA